MKWSIVTGASSGIGAEFARQLHQQGYNVVLIARRLSLLQELADELEAQRPLSTKVMAVDLTDPKGLQAIMELCDRIDVGCFVSNAGRGSFGHFAELDSETELNLIDLNIKTQTVLLPSVLQQMRKRGSGKVVIIASIAGFLPVPYMATYSATKSFNLTHGLALHQELKPYGVTVTSVCPGPVATQFGGVARVPGEATNLKRDDTKRVVEDALRALQRRAPWVIPGRIGPLLGLARFLPWNISVPIIARALRGSLPSKRY